MEAAVVSASIWSWEGWTATGVVLGLITSVAIYLHQSQIRDFRAELKSANDLARIRRSLAGHQGFRRYRARIRYLVAGLHRWFGAPLSIQALNRCLQIAFIYPILLYLVTWFAGGGGSFAGFVLLPPIEGLWTRLWSTLLIFVAGLSFGWGLRNLDTTAAWINIRIWHHLDSISISATPSLTFVTRLVAVVIAFFRAGVISVFCVLALTYLLDGTGALASADTGTVVVVLAGAISMAGAIGFFKTRVFVFSGVIVSAAGFFLVVAYDVAATGAPTRAVAFILAWITFLIILPLINAVLDWISWAATRYFLSRVVRVKGGIGSAFALTLDLLLDLVAAALCLIVLAAALPNMIELINLLLPWLKVAPTDWQTFLTSATNDPFGSGLLVWGMLVSTLFPTFIHLAVGFKALFDALTPIDGLKALLPQTVEEWPNLQSRYQAANRLFYRQIWWVPASLLSGGVVVGFFYGVYAFFGLFAWTLGAVAQCATSWKTGVCPLF